MHARVDATQAYGSRNLFSEVRCNSRNRLSCVASSSSTTHPPSHVFRNLPSPYVVSRRTPQLAASRSSHCLKEVSADE
eukprot:6185778-Pleurochrysis_carterae.AAC.2